MSITKLLNEYLDTQYEAYVAEQQASYLHAKAEATAIKLRVAKQNQREALARKATGSNALAT